MAHILVINAGSSSIKYQLIDADSGERSASGLVERIALGPGRLAHTGADGVKRERDVTVPDHSAGFAEMIVEFERGGATIESLEIRAVGHRVVQGGSDFFEPTLITDAVAARILELGELAPLHNPGQYQAIVAARKMFSQVDHVAVFDTAFHQTIPPQAYTYAIDREVAAKEGVRRYGFHGVSHQVVSRRAAEYLGRPLTSVKQIVLHLGNGASACAIDGGRSVDTSMGFTPLAGLMMGTRSGDIDPGVLLHLLRTGYSVDAVDELLNRRAGFAGLSCSNDFRDVWACAFGAGAGAGADADADARAAARLAIEVYVNSIKHYIGAYLAVLGGADTIVFTAGVGENHAAVRAAVCYGLSWLGIELDASRNAAASGVTSARRISADTSRVEVLVVPTDEEAEIARQTWGLVGAAA